MTQKLLLIILDGVPYRNWVRLFGNLEGWVQSGDAQRFKMSSEELRALTTSDGQPTRLQKLFRGRCLSLKGLMLLQ